ncbi:hypothetical protein ACFL1M_03585 [Patescibacteria group bacterium]
MNKNEATGTFELERAKGTNLTTLPEYMQGYNFSDFTRIPNQLKMKGLIAYLEMVAALNEQGLCFVDHKTDSIFLDEKTGKITITDAGSIREDGKYSWNGEVNGGLTQIMMSFFTKDASDPEFDWLAPPIVRAIVYRLDQGTQHDGRFTDFSGLNLNNARDVVNVLKDWQTNHRSALLNDETNLHSMFYYLAYGYKQNHLIRHYMGLDFTNIPDRTIDFLEAELHRRGLEAKGDIKGLESGINYRLRK